jgi:hypothetical protein
MTALSPFQAYLLNRTALKTLPTTPAKPKTVKPKAKKKERIDTTFLKARGQLHVRELIAEFFSEGHETKSGYWITPEFRISLSTGCFWRNIANGYSRRPAGDVLTLFLIAKRFLIPATPVLVPEGLSNLEALKLRIASVSGCTPGYQFIPEGFVNGVEAFSEWLEQFALRSEIHELIGYDS